MQIIHSWIFPCLFKSNQLFQLSISEYRKRKQQSSGTPPEPEPSGDTSATDKGAARGRSDSASSGTSSLSSDEEGSKISLSLDTPNLTALPLFTNAEGEEKKGNDNVFCFEMCMFKICPECYKPFDKIDFSIQVVRKVRLVGPLLPLWLNDSERI